MKIEVEFNSKKDFIEIENNQEYIICEVRLCDDFNYIKVAVLAFSVLYSRKLEVIIGVPISCYMKKHFSLNSYINECFKIKYDELYNENNNDYIDKRPIDAK